MTMQPAFPSTSGTRLGLVPLGDRQRTALGGVSAWGVVLVHHVAVGVRLGSGQFSAERVWPAGPSVLVPAGGGLSVRCRAIHRVPLRDPDVAVRVFRNLLFLGAQRRAQRIGRSLQDGVHRADDSDLRRGNARPQDLVAATLGMAIGIAGLGVRGIQGAGLVGVMAIDVANKNSSPSMPCQRCC